MRYTREDFIGADGIVQSLPTRAGTPGVYGLFGSYRALSNFHHHAIVVDRIQFQWSEAAYMAQKTNVLAEKMQLAEAQTPASAKKLGQLVMLRPDWESVKIERMEYVLNHKFDQDEYARAVLCKTDSLYIEESNWWGDNFWGVCDTDKGQNNLGLILMRVRARLNGG